MYDIDDLTMYQSSLSEQNMEHVAESSRALLAWAGDAGLERVLSPRVIPCCPLLASLPDTALCTHSPVIDYRRPHTRLLKVFLALSPLCPRVVRSKYRGQ